LTFELLSDDFFPKWDSGSEEIDVFGNKLPLVRRLLLLLLMGIILMNMQKGTS